MTRSTCHRQRPTTAYSCGACRTCSSLETIRTQPETEARAVRERFEYRSYEMAQIKLFGYTDKISVKPGDTVQFHVNADGTGIAEAQLVRLIHGDQHPSGPGFIEEEIGCAANGIWRVEKQYTQVGSFLEVADPQRELALEGSLTLCAFIHPIWPNVGHR